MYRILLGSRLNEHLLLEKCSEVGESSGQYVVFPSSFTMSSSKLMIKIDKQLTSLSFLNIYSVNNHDVSL